MTLKEQLDEKVLAQRQATEEFNANALQKLPEVIFDMIKKEFNSLGFRDLENGHLVFIELDYYHSQLLFHTTTTSQIEGSTGLLVSTLQEIMSQVAILVDTLGLKLFYSDKILGTLTITYVPPAAK